MTAKLKTQKITSQHSSTTDQFLNTKIERNIQPYTDLRSIGLRSRGARFRHCPTQRSSQRPQNLHPMGAQHELKLYVRQPLGLTVRGDSPGPNSNSLHPIAHHSRSRRLYLLKLGLEIPQHNQQIGADPFRVRHQRRCRDHDHKNPQQH